MSLFGEKCARCGNKRTRQEVEGVPTCEACEAILETRKRAASEDSRTCPLDKAVMNKDVVLNIIVDRCPNCDGVWLDGGELDLLRGALEAGMAADFARAMVFPV